MKDALRGTRFEDDESVIRAVRTWLREQETSWYRKGMHALVSRWPKAVDVDGDNVEK
jgi:23S rRNA maturation mini-RNase III